MKKIKLIFGVLVAILIIAVIYKVIDYRNHIPVKDMTDFTYAVELLGKEMTEVRQELGRDARLFKRSEQTGMPTSQFISKKSYKVEHSKEYADIRLDYPNDNEDALLDMVYYYINYEDSDNMQEVWEWVYTQWNALEKHFGRPADYTGGRTMNPILVYEDTLPGAKWVAGWKQGEGPEAEIVCVKVVMAANHLLRLELYTETDPEEITAIKAIVTE